MHCPSDLTLYPRSADGLKTENASRHILKISRDTGYCRICEPSLDLTFLRRTSYEILSITIREVILSITIRVL